MSSHPQGEVFTPVFGRFLSLLGACQETNKGWLSVFAGHGCLLPRTTVLLSDLTCTRSSGYLNFRFLEPPLINLGWPVLLIRIPGALTPVMRGPHLEK